MAYRSSWVRAQKLLAGIGEADRREVRTLLDRSVALGSPGKRAVVGLLRNESWHVRREAVYAVARQRDGRLACELVSALKDESWVVRHAALLALTSLLAFGDGTVRRRVSQAVDTRQVIELLHDNSAHVRGQATALLGCLSQAAVCMATPEPSTTREPARSAGPRRQDIRDLVDAGSTRALCAALDDPCHHVVSGALLEIRFVGGRRASPCVSALLDDNRPHIRTSSVVSTLAACATDEAVPGLRRVLIGDASAETRYYAAQALGTVGSAEAAEALTEALEDESAVVREKAVWELGWCTGREAVIPSLIRCLQEESDEYVREEACLVIAKTLPNSFDGAEDGPEKILEWWEKEGKRRYGHGDGVKTQHRANGNGQGRGLE